MRVLLCVILMCAAPTAGAQQVPEQWRLVEDLRIGAADGPNSLTGVHALLVEPEGDRIYVGQHRENLVRVFDSSSGQLLGVIGRRGQGPGEFNWMGEMGWHGDTLVIRDRALRRMSLFMPEGKHLRTEGVATAMIPGAGAAVPFAYLADGSMLAVTTHDVRSALSGQVEFAIWVQMTREGQILRTLARRSLSEVYGEMRVGTRGLVFAHPLSETIFVEPSPDGSSIVVVDLGSATAEHPEIRVTRLAIDGDTIYSRFYRFDAHPIPTQQIEEIYGRYERSFPEAPSGQVREAVRAAIKIPAMLPPIKAIKVAADGAVWLARAEENSQTSRWDVLDPEGRLQAVVRGPRGAVVRAIAGNAVWGTVSDEYDIPFVVRFSPDPG